MPGRATTAAISVCLLGLFAAAAAGLWVERPAGHQAPAPVTAPLAPPSSSSSPSPSPLATASPTAAQEPLLIPVVGVRAGQLADTFTQSRANGARAHDAIDILAPRGTPVVAAAAGTIEKLFLSKDGGNTIYLRSPDGTTIHYYAHLDGYARGLAEGARVRRGELLGTVGATGNADPATPHLHFAIWRTTPGAGWWQPAIALNPYPLLARNP